VPKCPRKQRQAKLDGRSVPRVYGVIQIVRKRYVDAEPTGNFDLVLDELCIDVPIACFVGIGKRAVRYFATNNQTIKRGLLSTKINER
jgi:hypothetical protein